MRRTKPISIALTVTFIAGVLSFFLAYKLRSQTVNSPLRPFIAQTMEYHFVPNSAEPKSTVYSTYARRSDGSHVLMFTSTAPDGTTAQVVNISDLRLRRFILLEPHTKSSSVFHLSEKETQTRQADEHGCSKFAMPAAPGHSAILGFDTLHVVSTSPTSTTDSWIAPELDCYVFKETYSIPEGAASRLNVNLIVESEPPGSMFEVPSSYVERSPAEIEAAYTARFPGHGYWGTKLAKIMQTRYESHRQ